MTENYPAMHILLQRSGGGAPQIIGHAEPQSVHLLPSGWPITHLDDILPLKKAGFLNMRSRPFTATVKKAKIILLKEFN